MRQHKTIGLSGGMSWENSAEYYRIVNQEIRSRMREILGEIRAGTFSQLLKDEEASGYPRLRQARERARALRVEQARRKLID